MEPGATLKCLSILDSIKLSEDRSLENDPYPMALSFVIGSFNRSGHFNSSRRLLKDMLEVLNKETWGEKSQLPKSFFKSMYWLLHAELAIALGDNDEALEHLNKMEINAARKDFQEYSPLIEKSFLNYLADLAIFQTATALKKSGNLEKAKIIFNKFFGELELTYSQGNLNFNSFANLCEIYYKLGDIENYNSELLRAKESIRSDHSLKSWLILAELYFLDNNFEEGFYYLQKIEKNFNVYKEQSGDKNFQFNFNTQMGLYYAALEKHHEAIKYYNKNFDLDKRYFSAAVIFPITNHINLAKSYLASSNYSKSIIETNKAIELIEGEAIKDPLSHDFKGVQKFKLLELFQLLSQIEFKQNQNLEKAISYNTKAINIISVERKKVFLAKDKQLLIEAAYPVFEQGISLLFQSKIKDKEARIFKLMEQSKALNLIDDLVQSELFNQIDVNPILIADEKRISGLINFTRSQLDEYELSQENFKSLNDKLDSLQNLKTLVIDKIYTSSNASILNNEANIDLDHLQKNLIDKKTCFIEFFQGKEYIYSLGLNSNQIQISRLPTTKENIEKIEHFYTSIAKGDNLFRSLGNELYEKILAPYEALLRKQILIVPDGILNVLPFDALCTKSISPSTRLKDYPFLIKENNLSLIYSALFLHIVQQNKIKQNNDKLLAINPDYTANADFESLDFSAQEINFLDEAFDARVLSSSFANKSQIDSIIENYSMIHFSSHAVADLKKGRNSYIALDNAKTSIDDSCRLKAHEIRNYKLQAELVVLSACETGIGSFEKGEGVMSLGRSFIHAGAKGVLSSLWSVSDKSTALLTIEFYKLINTGLNKPEAISISKRNLLKDANFAHPYFWAGFYYTGDIKSKSSFNLNWSWIALPLLMFFIFFIYKLRSNRP